MAVLAALAASCGASSERERRSGEVAGCRRVELSQELGWTDPGGVTWDAGQEELWVINLLGKEVERVSRRGKVLGKALKDALEAEGSDGEPVHLARRGESVMISVVQGWFLQVNGGNRIVRRTDVWGTAVGDAGRLAGWSEWVWQDDAIVMLTILRGEGSAQDKVVVAEVPLPDPGAFKVLREFPDRDESFYDVLRLGDSHFVSEVNGRIAVLGFDEAPTIYVQAEPGGDLEAIDSMPAGLEVRPELEHIHWNSPDDYVKAMTEVEGSSLPMGLFGWRGALYVVYRLAVEGGSEWWIARIDPILDRLEGVARLPTQAKHLLVAPGTEEWAFIEKGPVWALGVQETQSILFVPTARVEALSSTAGICESGND